MSDFPGIRNVSSLNDLNSLNNLSGLNDLYSLLSSKNLLRLMFPSEYFFVILIYESQFLGHANGIVCTVAYSCNKTDEGELLRKK